MENEDATMIVKYFKAQRKTRRFNKNQRVWVTIEYANHMEIWFKFRGKGRYVSGLIDKFSSEVGEIKTADVADDFGRRVKKDK